MSITLVLDAMGVIFAAADDVVELLQPFIANHDGETNPDVINDLYIQASLGRLSPEEFWQFVRLNPKLEDEYLPLHRLTEGALAFLQKPPANIASIWCLSNDVAQWSRKLRHTFELDDFFTGVIVSGDVGMRKPDPAIYQLMLSRVGVPSEQIVFVDDRPKNLEPATNLGVKTVLFGSPPRTSFAQFGVQSFSDLDALLRSLA